MGAWWHPVRKNQPTGTTDYLMAKPVWQKLLAVPAAKNHVSGPVWGHTDQRGIAAIGKKGA